MSETTKVTFKGILAGVVGTVVSGVILYFFAHLLESKSNLAWVELNTISLNSEIFRNSLGKNQSIITYTDYITSYLVKNDGDIAATDVSIYFFDSSQLINVDPSLLNVDTEIRGGNLVVIIKEFPPGVSAKINVVGLVPDPAHSLMVNGDIIKRSYSYDF